MADTKHTPTPWKVEDLHGDTQIIGGDGNAICIDTTYYPVAPSTEDMNHIVKCVNLHEELVEALKQAYAVCKAHEYLDHDIEEVLNKAGAL